MKVKKVNIIWIHSHFNYWMGGTKYIYEVISRLKKKYFVICVVEDFNNFSEKKYKKIGLKINKLNYLSSYSLIYWIFLPLFLIIDWINLNKIIKKNKLDKNNTVIISSMFPMNAIARLTNFKHIQLCFEPFSFFYDNEFIKDFSFFKKIFIKIIKQLYSPLDRMSISSANKVLTLNSVTQNLVKKIFNVKSELTQAGVDSNLFKPYTSNKIQNKYGGEKLIIHSTDYSPIKGTDRILSAFAITKIKVKNAKLLITSTIENKIELEKLKKQAFKLNIKDDVEFLGFVSINDLPQYYSLAKILVQGSSSLKSGTTSMALPVKEAMCCETPVIRPNAGGDDVVDGKTGFLVDPRNTNLLAKKMTLLLLNDDLSTKMGKLARKDISKKYTWENTTGVFINSVQEILL